MGIKSLFASTLLLASSLSAAVALPTTKAARADAEPRSAAVRLAAEVVSQGSSDLEVDGWELRFAYKNATEGTLTLVNADGNTTGVPFAESETGGVTVDTFPCDVSAPSGTPAGVVVVNGGSFTIPPALPAGLRCNDATDEVELAENSAGDLALQYGEGSWMACPGTTLGLSTDDIVAVGYRTQTQRPLLGCVDVRLVQAKPQ